MKKFLLMTAMVCAAMTSLLKADDVLRPGDSFELRLSGVPGTESGQVSGTYTLDGSGNLNLPFIGKLAASNMTASQIQAAAERTYVNQGIYTHPTITITVAATARFVSVGGQVKSPQRVAYTPDMTVMSAINAAGDFNEFADQKHVRLTRGKQVTVVNCKAIRSDPNQDLKVSPGDQIQVPQTVW